MGGSWTAGLSWNVVSPWTWVVIAGLLEVAWVMGLRSTEGFTRLVPSVFVGAAIVASMVLLSVASRALPQSTAYAVWVGIGIGGTVAMEAWLHRELPSVARVFFLLLLLVALVGLRLSDGVAHLPPDGGA